MCAILALDKRASIFIRDEPIFLSERMSHKDYDREGSAEKISLVTSLMELGAKVKIDWW
jgi:hypothetical protein